MDAVFKTLLSLSLQAGIIAAAVMVLRVLLRKAPKKLICSLWILVALRLLVPFSLESPLSLMRSPELPEILTEAAVEDAPSAPIRVPPPAVPDPEVRVDSPLPAPIVPGPSVEVQPEKTPDLLTVLEIIWLAGIGGMLLYGGISYGQLRRKVAPALEVRSHVYVCDYIASPFVMGILRPRIYLPSAIGNRDIPYILAHEQAHISRLDPLWKLLGFVLLTLHWFNPLLWIAFILFCRDMECACDEKVISGMGDAARVPYSNALLNCSLPRGRIYPLAFGEIGVKQRIKAVLSYKKPALWLSLAAILALVIAGVCLLTNRPGNSLAEICTFPENQALEIMGNFKLYDMKSPEERSAIEDFLHAVRYAPSPLEVIPDPHALGTLSLTAGSMEERRGLIFTPDGSQVAVGSPDAPEAGYTVENPKAVTQFFSAWLKPFANRETSGKPLWQEDAPWVWTKGVDTDRLEEVRLRTWTREKPDTDAPGPVIGRSTQGGGIYNDKNVKTLLDLLHGLQESDFTPAADFRSTPMEDICEPVALGETCRTVYFHDNVDSRVLVIRQEQTRLDFYASEPCETEPERTDRNLTFRHWEVQNSALLSYMQPLRETSPTVATFVGWEHDWDIPREMSHGDALIRLPVIKGWNVEEVPYLDDSTPWGYRIKPEGETGDLFFSFWPQGFSLEEEDRFHNETNAYGFRNSYISYPASVIKPDGSFDTTDAVWSYAIYQCDLGDYAIVNEGADLWYFRYREAIDDICTLVSFQAMPPEDMPKTMPGPDISRWRKTVAPEDLEAPRLLVTELTPDKTNDGTERKISLDPKALEPFLSVLRGLESEALRDMHYQQNHTLQSLMVPDADRGLIAAILLPIREQSQVAVLVYQYRADVDRSSLKFFVTDQYESFLKDPGARVPFGEYYLEDEMLTFGAEQLITRVYSRKWQEPLTMVNGPAKIRLSLPTGWDYEEVPGKDEETPWGFRVRPQGEEGSLFFSFCPEGMPVGPDGPINRLEIYRPQFAPFGGSVQEQYSDDDYDSDWERREDACWEYRLYQCSFGDYVIFNENADSWMSARRQEIQDILTLCMFQGDPVNR